MNKNLTQTLVIILVIFLLVFIFSSHLQAQKENPYHLAIVSEVEVYDSLVAVKPDNSLVDLQIFIPRIVLDIRYATNINFTGQKVYEAPKAFVRKPVADSLLKIQNELKTKGLGLKIYDAYRPYSATLKFYEVYPDTNFVAAPWRGSMHNRGCAVDVTLIDLKTNKELEMPTPFDDFTEKAGQLYMELPPRVLQNRQLLRDIMIRHGFIQYDPEWWHYNFKGWEDHELMDVSFKELK
jgi:D-alanyl-D-alanine dipeptidase